MDFITSIILVVLFIAGSPGRALQSDASIYSFHVTGRIELRKSQSPPGATVYVMGTRPLVGRIPWAHANTDGTFSIEFQDAPDTFRVCAHPGETGGMLPLAPTREEARKMPIKLSCTKDFSLDGQHLEQCVQLKLK